MLLNTPLSNTQVPIINGLLGTTSDSPIEEQVKQILHAARSHLGMEVGFVSQFVDGRRLFRHVDTTLIDSPVIEGDSHPLEESYCNFIIKGDLPALMQNAADIPAALAFSVTRSMPVGAHLSAPIHLNDGSVYGTFCCFSRTPDRSLNERDLAMLRVCADIAGRLIQADLAKNKELTNKAIRIKRIIENKAFTIVYQPIYRLSDNRVTGFEALSRFSETPYRSPDIWFAEADEVGLGVELEFAATEEACIALSLIPAAISLAINLSPASILSPLFTAVFEGLPIERLVLEITEHAAIANYKDIESAIRPFRERGLRLAVDDAGAGYSSFKHVLDLKPDFIKLDMSLTRNVDSDPGRRALARALTQFGLDINSQVIAEGVETMSEMDSLRSIGVTKVQGYLVGRPMPLAETVQLASGGG